MCLITSQNGFKTADKDIVCYKELYDSPILGLSTPYQLYRVPEEAIQGRRPFKAGGTPVFRQQLSTYPDHILTYSDHILTEGAIHTYKEKPRNRHKNHTVFKCIIPKGTEYATGTDSGGTECYASREIVFIRQLSWKGLMKGLLKRTAEAIANALKNK